MNFNNHVIFALLLCTLLPYRVFLDDKCMYIDYRGRNQSDDSGLNCTLSRICQKQFRISYIQIPPYSTAELLESMIKKCCGKCTRIKLEKQFLNISETSFAAFNNSDFILPFIGRSTAKSLYGYLFIPIVDVPNVFLFTPKHRSIIEELILGCLNLYPMIVLCLLMAAISGFIVWILETWHEPHQFPRAFLPGVFEGFWYSLVSMTTVGYGDRIVTSIPARLFSVLWILIGIIMFGLLTSLFTAEILKVTEPHSHTMSGSKIGALKYRDYDATLIVKHGGVVRETDAWNFYSDVLMLVRMLRTGIIDGFVLDKYTLAFTIGYFNWKKTEQDFLLARNISSPGESYEVRREDIEFFEKKTYRTLKDYQGEKLAYGVLVKNREDYDYFRHAMEDNRIALEAAVGSLMNEQFPRVKEPDIFATSSEHFQDAIKIIGIIIGLIGLFGLFFEIPRNKKKLTKIFSRLIDKREEPILERKTSV